MSRYVLRVVEIGHAAILGVPGDVDVLGLLRPRDQVEWQMSFNSVGSWHVFSRFCACNSYRRFKNQSILRELYRSQLRSRLDYLKKLQPFPDMSTPNEEKSQKPKIPWYQDVDGFRIPGMFSVEAYKSALAYKPRPDDLIIANYPKCGSTWLQNIIALIFREGRVFDTVVEFLSSTPFLELTGAEAVKKMMRPGAIKIHLPFHLAPWSPETKYICIARNPKDCCVSFYHHTESMPGYKFVEGEFDDYFELFINGEVDFGDYFDTTLSWWEHRNDPNVLFITYEQLKKDTVNEILKIAGFIGPEYKEKLEKNEQMLKDVVRHSSFSFMKEYLNRKMEEMAKIPKELIRNNPDIPAGMREMLLAEGFAKKDTKINFIRKGIVGDWRNYFSPTQNARMEKKIREKFTGTGLLDIWKDDM